MFCKDNRKQEKIIFHINQCFHIKSSLGKFLLQYFPPEFNRFKQMRSNYLGSHWDFVYPPSLKPGKLPKKILENCLKILKLSKDSQSGAGDLG